MWVSRMFYSIKSPYASFLLHHAESQDLAAVTGTHGPGEKNDSYPGFSFFRVFSGGVRVQPRLRSTHGKVRNGQAGATGHGCRARVEKRWRYSLRSNAMRRKKKLP